MRLWSLPIMRRALPKSIVQHIFVLDLEIKKRVVTACIDDIDVLAVVVEDNQNLRDLVSASSEAIGKWVQTILSLEPTQVKTDIVDRFITPTLVLARKKNGDALWLSTIHDSNAPRR